MNNQFQSQLQTYWDQFVQGYANVEQNPAVFGLNLLNMLRIETADSILEAGCGPGMLIPEIIQRKRNESKYLSIDISQEMIDYVQRRVKSYFHQELDDFFDKICWQAQQGDVENLDSIADNSFDVYYSNMVFHLTGNPELGLKEAHRVLKVGGKMGFAVWGRREYSDQFTIWKETLLEVGYELGQGHDAFTFGEDPKRVKELLIKIGFNNIYIWNQQSAYDRFDVESYLQGQNPKTLEILNTKPELIVKFKEAFQKKLSQKFQKHEPLMSDCLMVIASK